jgi:hypothetical protein
MWKLLKKVLRAAVAQPWEYVGEGAPHDWEFRVSPADDGMCAVYNPVHGEWWIFKDVVILAKARMSEMDEHTEDWRQFLSVEDPDE